MPKFVTALYENLEDAEEAIEALHHYGIAQSDIQLVDQQRQQQGFFDRLFIDENGDQPKNYNVMGIDQDDAEFYSQLVRQGYCLVIALSANERVDEVRQILERSGPTDPGRLILREITAEENEEEWTRERPPPTVPSGATTGRWFEVVEVKEDEWRQREGAKAHAVHVAPKRNISRMSLEGLPGANLSPTFRALEPQFREHFRERFQQRLDEELTFDDARLAYRFGVRLAENPTLADRDWSGVEEHARTTWREHGAGPWERYGEAVQFGWMTTRQSRDTHFARP